MTEYKKIVEIPEEYRPKIEDLPGDLARIAEEIERSLPGHGVEKTLLLAQIFRGQPVYFRNIDSLIRRIRNDAIRKEYDRGGVTMLQLAGRFGLGLRQIKYILADTDNTNDVDERQMRLPQCDG